MPIKVFPEEVRTGQVWCPFGFSPSEESFVVVGEPQVMKLRDVGRRVLRHPVVHLRSGKPADRTERSVPEWRRMYVRVS